MTLREEIDAAIVRQGLARKDVAAKLDISEGYLSDLMNRKRDLNPSLLDAFIAALEPSKTQATRWHRLGATEEGWKIK